MTGSCQLERRRWRGLGLRQGEIPEVRGEAEAKDPKIKTVKLVISKTQRRKNAHDMN